MDFAKGADRVAACKWYIDQVRRRFDEGNYQYVELAGFYPISEEIVTPGDGYCHELKKSEEVIPQVAEYLHSINQSFCWIPYNRAAGYTKWKEMGIDYAYMQPNHYWDDKGAQAAVTLFLRHQGARPGDGIRIRREHPRGGAELRRLQKKVPRVYGRSEKTRRIRKQAAELLPRHQPFLRSVGIDGRKGQRTVP